MASFPEQSFITANRQGDEVLLLCAEWSLHNPAIVADKHWIRNTERKVGILRYAARYKTNSKIKQKTRAANDVSVELQQDLSLETRRYYTTNSIIVGFVRDFFRENSDYTLLVDITTFEHSCVLHMTRRFEVGDRVPVYTFHAFDPNWTCNSHCFVNLAKEIAKSVKSINVWCSRTPNRNGLCFSLSWRFVHAVMYEGYDPIKYERVAGIYNVTRNVPKLIKPKKNEPQNQAVGYHKVKSLNRKQFQFKLKVPQ